MLGTNGSTLQVTGYTVNDGDGGNDYTVSLHTAGGTITPAALSISATGQTKVYDGTTASTAAPTDSGLITVGGDTITGLSQAFASKNVLGTNGSTLQVTGYTVNDGDGGNDYTVSLNTAGGTITPVALSITATGQTKVYDGTTTSTAAPTYSGLVTVGGDTITGLNQAFASKNVLGTNGSTLQVTGYTINDGDGGNDYTVTLHTASGTITPAALAISATSQTKVYDGTTASTAIPTYSGLMTAGGDTVTGLTQAFASKNVLGTNGSTLQVTGYTVNDGDGGNDYTVTLHTALGTITPAALTITATGQTKVYDGTTTSTAVPTYSGLIAAAGDTVTGLSQAFASKNVLGTNGSTLQVTGYTVGDGDGGKDYTVTLHTVAGTITPAALSISVTSQTKVYDGTTTSTAVPTYSGLITVGGDTITGLTQAFASKNVLGTNGSTLQVAGYTINDGDGGNDYTVILHAASGTITPAALTITASNESKTYGTTLTIPGTAFAASGLFSGDSVTSVTLASAGTTAAASVGTYPITASNATGTGLGNYTISYVGGTLTVTAAPWSTNGTIYVLDPTAGGAINLSGEREHQRDRRCDRRLEVVERHHDQWGRLGEGRRHPGRRRRLQEREPDVQSPACDRQPGRLRPARRAPDAGDPHRPDELWLEVRRRQHLDHAPSRAL